MSSRDAVVIRVVDSSNTAVVFVFLSTRLNAECDLSILDDKSKEGTTAAVKYYVCRQILIGLFSLFSSRLDVYLH